MKLHFILPGVAAMVLATASFAADNSEEFVVKAIKGDNAEIMVGQLAQKNGGSEAVRRFGKMLESDHAQHREKLLSLASSMNITAPVGISDEAKSNYDKLSKLRGEKFDQEFADEMVEDHKKDIDEYKEQGKEKGTGNIQKVAELARSTLPTLEKHLQHAQALAKH